MSALEKAVQKNYHFSFDNLTYLVLIIATERASKNCNYLQFVYQVINYVTFLIGYTCTLFLPIDNLLTGIKVCYSSTHSILIALTGTNKSNFSLANVVQKFQFQC